MRRFAGRLLILGIVSALFLIPTGCQEFFGPSSANERIILWNGEDFTGWTFFLPDKNIDTNDIWSVRNGVIYCSGIPNGYMQTEAEYENYFLHLEWRWPDTPTNSGVLLHKNGPDKIWPRSVECQLQAGNAGDLVLIGGTGITVDGENKQNTERPFVIIPKKQKSTEKPAGQWNTYDIYCDQDKISCYVNGKLQNEATAATDTSGRICLQSEGSPIEFRNIYQVPYKPIKK